MDTSNTQCVDPEIRRPSICSFASEETICLEDALKSCPPSPAESIKDFSPFHERPKSPLTRAARMALKVFPFALPSSSRSPSTSASSSSTSLDDLSLFSGSSSSASPLTDDTSAEDLEEWDAMLRGIEKTSSTPHRSRTSSCSTSPIVYSPCPTKAIVPFPHEPTPSRDFLSPILPRSRKHSAIQPTINPNAPFSLPTSPSSPSTSPSISPSPTPATRIYSPASTRATSPISEGVSPISRPESPEDGLGAWSFGRMSEMLERPSSPNGENERPSLLRPLFRGRSMSPSFSPSPSRAVSPIAASSRPTSPFRRIRPPQTFVGFSIEMKQETETFDDFSDEE
ncbi:hypothetical protein OF83DRAFT_289637 [Amylostereum chailletii]|nr:hypothetical protein OF83DRAFT_289637 [Amylostereum chailletii]